jgi:cell division protein FtsX
LVALTAFAGGDAIASAGSSNPTVIVVELQPDHTTAERVAIEHRLAANPQVRKVQYVTRAQQLTAVAHWDANVARAIQRRLRDAICVIPTGPRAADEVLDSFNLRQPGVLSIDETSSGGPVLYPCGYAGDILGRLAAHR